jgi:Ca2+-binding RTX toxin-like protein
MIFNKISSIWDEAWWKSDSVGMTSFYKIDSTSTSYGSFNFVDYKDYYAITPGIGTFKLVVTTEGLNESSYIGNYLFDTRILNSYGGLELTSDTLGPDIYSDSITFTSYGYNTYYVEITNTIFSDFKYAATLNIVSNSGGGGITDTTAPTLSSITPADGATGVAVGANFVLTFNEAVKAGTGSFVVKSGTTTVSTIAVTDTSQVTFSGSTVTINPTSNLDYSKSYTVTVASGVIKDSAGNSWSGTGTNPYDFTTVAANTSTTVAYTGNESSNKLAANNEFPYSKSVYMYGYGGDDTLTGAFLHKNFIYGGAGNDQLNGGASQNIIFGEDGNDTINAWQAEYSELFGGRITI